MKRAAEHPVARSRVFGRLSSGETITEFTLSNRSGMIVKALDYGGIITALHAPDRHGRLADVVLGFDDLAAYEQQAFYIGSIIGRCAGRIANGRFSMAGKDITLARNNGDHHLHGGVSGFDRALWAADISTPAQLTLRRRSVHGEEGYPGNLDIAVTYGLTEEDELTVEYRATTDAPTVVNLTQHSYFNLSGEQGSDILEHTLQVSAAEMLLLDGTSIPTGARRNVAGSVFDFRQAKPIGQDIELEDPQLRLAEGYDHYWVLDKIARGQAPEPALTLVHEQSGRCMTVSTTEPGVQVYTGNGIDRTLIGKANTAIRRRAGICLETQNYPDAPNHRDFPSIRLDPGRQVRSTTVFRFSAIKGIAAAARTGRRPAT